METTLHLSGLLLFIVVVVFDVGVAFVYFSIFSGLKGKESLLAIPQGSGDFGDFWVQRTKKFANSSRDKKALRYTSMGCKLYEGDSLFRLN